MNTSVQSVSNLTATAVCTPIGKSEKVPLFVEYPQLQKRLPYVPLCRYPTPVEKLGEVGKCIGLDRLYVKRDDLSGDIYGGNKVRKLEFLLGDALRAGAKEVITFGFAGSNHALATAIYAKQLGMRSTSMLMPQPNAHYVRRNLLASHHHSAELHLYGNATLLRLGAILKLLRSKAKYGAFPRVIPPGGSCPLGVIGYVNAALELKEQIVMGALPEPDCIYVPAGTMGTSAGLLLGLRAADLRSQLVAVRVVEERFSNARRMLRLAHATGRYLRELDRTFPKLEIGDGDVSIRGDCLGDGYAWFTAKAMKAAELMRTKGGIILNGTYSAKAFAALIDDADKQVLRGKTVLFWNTYNSKDLSSIVTKVDYHALPPEFHRYFEEDVQSLDKDGYDR